MTKLLRLSLAVAGLALLSDPARAQSATDSAFAVSKGDSSLFRVDRNGTAFFGGTYNGGSPNGLLVTGSGVRMLWYPGKGAVRGGGINGSQWDDQNIGLYSAAFGYNARASADYGFAVGNNAAAAGTASFAMGEHVTAIGTGSVAMGSYVRTANTSGFPRSGTFVFGDRSSSGDSIGVSVNNAAVFRVTGGFHVFTSSTWRNSSATGVAFLPSGTTSLWGQPNALIATSTGAYLSYSGVWETSSDVNRKHLFQAVRGEDVLARLRTLPIRSWSYRVDEASVRHLGPTAQDFHATFGLGSGELTIGTVDADGVALAAAQALEARTAAQQQRIDALEAQNAAQARELAEMRARMERLEALVTAGQGAARP